MPAAVADPVAWTSLGISVAVGLFTTCIQVLSYRRSHYPRLAVHARQVSTMSASEDEPGSIELGSALEIRVVNTGTRSVEVSQVHTQKEGEGVVWLREANGWIDLRLEPGQSKQWMEALEHHWRKREFQDPALSPNFRIRAVATTSDNRTFCSRFLWVQHPAGPLNLRRLKWENRMRRLAGIFRRKPHILN